MQEIVVIDGEIELENTLDGEVELEAITDLDPEVVLSAGGGVTPSGTINITENGTYNVTEYASADVDVQGGITPTGTKQININTNGTVTEDVTSYANAEINVNVPASAVDTGTKSISSNGTHDVVGYANASVNVPNSYSQSDEGKVVSNGALVAQTSDTVTQNGTVDTTLINSLTVNVSGGGGSLPMLLNFQTVIPTENITSQNKLSLQFTAVGSSQYIIFVTAAEFPDAPDETYYQALSWGRNLNNSTGSRILRPNGTIGTDAQMVTYSISTGIVQLGGDWGTFMAGKTYYVYLFEVK